MSQTKRIAAQMPLLWAALLGSCGEVTAPEERDFVCITEIEVREFTDGFTPSLEIEVHMYENGSGEFIACSGQRHGLEQVDISSVRYQVEASFRKPSGGGDLLYDEISHKSIYLMVIEDDQIARPAPADTIPDTTVFRVRDDVVGISPPFEGSALVSEQVMSFGKVSHLRLVRRRRPI